MEKIDEQAGRSPPEDGAPSVARRGARLPPQQRKRALIEQAVAYFSEEGFDGGTRELAKRMGVTQPLIYRYFPSKEDLINEVYRAVYLAQWKDAWTLDLRRRDRPLQARLTSFYADYTRTIFNRAWMRIFFFAGLKGLDINARYVDRVVTHLLLPICEEARAEFGVETGRPVTRPELELVWTMHGAIFYQGIRAHIYRMPGEIDHDRAAAVAIAMYLGRARAEIEAALADPGTPDAVQALVPPS